ncbi:MAG: hypothetical protein ACI9J3_003789 [Parvicellaceae bacterium]|jgi:hypothetical protein
MKKLDQLKQEVRRHNKVYSAWLPIVSHDTEY